MLHLPCDYAAIAEMCLCRVIQNLSIFPSSKICLHLLGNLDSGIGRMPCFAKCTGSPVVILVDSVACLRADFVEANLEKPSDIRHYQINVDGAIDATNATSYRIAALAKPN